MDCRHCGFVFREDGRYCPECGTERLATLNKPFQPLLLIQPKMVTWVILVRYIPVQLNLTLMGGLIFGLMIVAYHLFSGTLVHPLRPFIFFGTVFFIMVPLFIYIAYRKTLAGTRYEFYTDRIEYYEGLWTVQHKTVYYKQIAGLDLSRNLIQRFYQVGTIRIDVPSFGSKFRGLFIADIPHSQEMYDKINQLILER